MNPLWLVVTVVAGVLAPWLVMATCRASAIGHLAAEYDAEIKHLHRLLERSHSDENEANCQLALLQNELTRLRALLAAREQPRELPCSEP